MKLPCSHGLHHPLSVLFHYAFAFRAPAGEAETIFQKAILEQGRGRVLDTLAEIQERSRAVKDLEQSLVELHQIFLDMAVLVEAQGEMLDNIEKQVSWLRAEASRGYTVGACL